MALPNVVRSATVHSGPGSEGKALRPVQSVDVAPASRSHRSCTPTWRRPLTRVLIVASLAVLPATSAAWDEIQRQQVNDEAEMFASHCYEEMWNEVADDVYLEGALVQAISWWGFSYHDRDRLDFYIRFYERTAEGAPGALVYEHLAVDVPGEVRPPWGREYLAEIPPFLANGDYMLSIVEYCRDYYFRWRTGDGNDVTIWIRGDLDGVSQGEWTSGDHPWIGLDGIDMSFVLWGELPATPTEGVSWSRIKSTYRGSRLSSGQR